MLPQARAKDEEILRIYIDSQREACRSVHDVDGIHCESLRAIVDAAEVCLDERKPAIGLAVVMASMFTLDATDVRRKRFFDLMLDSPLCRTNIVGCYKIAKLAATDRN
jgi:hypothetical protein